jgi:hypothetical protein
MKTSNIVILINNLVPSPSHKSRRKHQHHGITKIRVNVQWNAKRCRQIHEY